MKHTSTLWKAHLNKLHKKFVTFIVFASQKRSSFLLCAIISYPCLYATFLIFVLCSPILYLLSLHFLLIPSCCIIISLLFHPPLYAPFVYFPHRHATYFARPIFFSSTYYYNPEKHTQDIDK